jgi:hypothetical protein
VLLSGHGIIIWFDSQNPLPANTIKDLEENEHFNESGTIGALFSRQHGHP